MEISPEGLKDHSQPWAIAGSQFICGIFCNTEVTDLLSIIVCLIVSLQSQGETYLAFAWSFLDIFVFDLHGYMGVIVMLTVNDTFKWTLSAKERLTHHIAFFHAQDLWFSLVSGMKDSR